MKSSVACFALLLLSFSTVINLSAALLISGAISTGSQQWQFITKFCFAQSRGSLDYSFSYPVDYSVQNFLMYYDEQWPQVYPSAKSCWDKQQVVNVTTRFNIVPLTDEYFNTGCTRVSNNQTGDIFVCNYTLKFTTARDRWWFFVISNCPSQQGLSLTYSMHMTNGNPGDEFFAEFSADEFYILPVDIMFFCMNCIIFGFSCYVGSMLNKEQLLHSTFKLFMASLFLECLQLLISMLAFVRYGQTGIYPELWLTLANVIGATGTVTFILLLLLIALGYTITLGRLSTLISVSLAIFICLFYLANIVLYSIYYYTIDAALVVYLFNSPVGYVIVALRLIAWCAFMVASLQTMYNNERKRKFYTVFIPSFTIWFWANPVIVFIAINVINPWALQKVVNGLDLSVTFCGFLFFLVITRPTKANKNFPYHIRTCQISAMSEIESMREDLRIRGSDVPQEGVNFDALFTVSGGKSNHGSPLSMLSSNGRNGAAESFHRPITTFEAAAFGAHFASQSSFPALELPSVVSDREPIRVTELPSTPQLHSVE